jgi:hypothetical protein
MRNREVEMEKLRLEIDALRVETFDAGAADGLRGTVQAQSISDVTQVATFACCIPTRRTCTS